jgi:transcriptional pleiotropic regulator of transition state genes
VKQVSIHPTKYRPIGIVRRVDQLGRIVLPKSLRERYSMNEGDPVEIIVSGDNIILEKYLPKCIFCGTIEHVEDYRERSVCRVCIGQMIQHSRLQAEIN